MGISCSWITAITPPERLQRALFASIPELEILKHLERVSIDTLDEENHLLRNVKQMLSALGFYDVAGHAVCIDPSMTWGMNDEVLAHASSDVGPILSLTLATHGGCAGFGYYADGQRRRFVFNDNENLTQSGDPLPEEQDIAVEKFYWSECESLWTRFGCGTLTEYPELIDVVVVRDHAAEARWAKR
jgi:hypothetical protein